MIARLQARELPDETTKVASAPDTAYPDLWRTPVTKVASEAPARKPHPDELALRRSHLRKLAHDLPTEVAELGVRWDMKIAEIVDRCRIERHDHRAFEKSAVAVHGAEILPELQAVRARLGFAPMAATAEKLAEVREFLVAAPTPLTNALSGARDFRTADHQKAATLAAVRTLHTQARERSCG